MSRDDTVIDPQVSRGVIQSHETGGASGVMVSSPRRGDTRDTDTTRDHRTEPRSIDLIHYWRDPAELIDDSDQRLAEAIAAGQRHRPRWQQHAACRGHDVDLFHPRRGQSSEPAKAICSTCTVVTDCLTWALNQPGDHGIAAGMSGSQRRRLRAERKRGAA